MDTLEEEVPFLQVYMITILVKLSFLPFDILSILYYAPENDLIIWIYTALHGGYGVLWFLKELSFPDKSFRRPLIIKDILIGLLASISFYSTAPLICQYSSSLAISNFQIFLTIFVWTIGIFFQFTSDMQKYTFLQVKGRALLTSGLWSISRNPNYFGELLIYISFLSLSRHYFPIISFLLYLVLYWIPRMKKKEKRLAKYGDEFIAYKKTSSLFIPFIY